MLFQLLPNGVDCSGVVSSVHKGIRLDPHRQPVQVGNALDDVDGHGGHFCSLHRQREQACLEGFTHQSQPPKTAFDTNCRRSRDSVPPQAQTAGYRLVTISIMWVIQANARQLQSVIQC